MPASGAGGPRDSTFPAFAFALAKAVAVRAFVAAVNPAASTNPWVFFFFQGSQLGAVLGHHCAVRLVE